MGQLGVSVLKNVLLIAILSFTLLFGSKIETERKIYDTIIHAVLPNYETVHLWSDSKVLLEELGSLRGIQVVNDVHDADIAIVTKRSDLKCDCLLFVTSYPLLKRYKNRAIGGFFWQKGRPNILFLQPNLQKNGIELPHSMRQFVEDDF